MENKMVIKLFKYFHLILGTVGLLTSVYNMINTGDFGGHFSSLLSGILFIVIAFRIKYVLFFLKNKSLPAIFIKQNN